jgi:NAD(P)-dependent dehydrogenase (short-subunit alcohol dehydrogenase family)
MPLGAAGTLLATAAARLADLTQHGTPISPARAARRSSSAAHPGENPGMTTFGFESTTDDVLDGHDLTDVNVVVTGTSAGLGVETARALVTRGATVVGVVRDPDKARHNLDEAGAHGVDLYEADLASLASIRAFTDRFFADGHDRIDVLIANAGVMACPRASTADGFELQFGTNHLGHFVLVNRLLPLLLTGTPSRIVTLSSAGHRFGNVDLDDPGFDHTPYDAWVAYGRAKTANVLFAVELDRRLSGRSVRATSVHPGGIPTELGRHLTDETLTALVAARGRRTVEWKSVPQGAATAAWAGFVAAADDVGGRYCEDCAVAPVIDDPDESPGVMRYALDPGTAAALWVRSEELVGETFDP